MNVVCILLGNPPVSEFYMPTKLRNTLFHLHRRVGVKILHTYPPMKMEHTACSETSAYKIQTPGHYPEESIQQNLNELHYHSDPVRLFLTHHNLSISQ